MPNRPDDLVVSVEPRKRAGVAVPARATHEQSQQAVSAVPVGIANAVAPDTFRGDTALLRRSIEGLLALDADDAIRPHGIGGHARKLLTAAYHRLEA